MTEDQSIFHYRDEFDLTEEEIELVTPLLSDSSQSNQALRLTLDWDPDTFFTVRNELFEKGVVTKGRGRGGRTMLLPLAELEEDSSEFELDAKSGTERDLYEPFATTIRDGWGQDQGYRRLYVEVTAQQGARRTGGGWTRPDITAVAVETHTLVPGKQLDVITFELKTTEGTSIQGVFEAAAHTRSATQGFLAVHSPDDDVEDAIADWQRIEDECRRFGVGLITFGDPKDYDTFDTIVRPERHIPEPRQIDAFLRTQLSAQLRSDIEKDVR